MIQIIIYTGTEHNVKGCLFDPNEVWCYTDLHCADDSGAQHQSALG